MNILGTMILINGCDTLPYNYPDSLYKVLIYFEAKERDGFAYLADIADKQDAPPTYYLTISIPEKDIQANKEVYYNEFNKYGSKPRLRAGFANKGGEA